MSNMSLGTVTFTAQPNDMTCIDADRSCAAVQTYSSIGFFSWDATLIGKKLELDWSYMPADQYSDLKTLEAADAGVVFNPQDGTGITYNVEIESIYGKYCLGKVARSSSELRKDVKMTLLIISVIPAP
jgi:hypothetical protein